MIKIIPSLVLVAALVSTSFAQSPKVIDKVSKSIVSVTWVGDENDHAFCTGIQIGINRVLTVAHCLPAIGAARDVFVNGQLARIVKRDDSMGLLDVLASERPILDLREVPSVGSPVVSFGFAWGQGLHALRRNVAAIVGDHLIIDGPIAPGMSGGPIVDEDGKLVAINQGTNNVVGLACTSKEIKEFLKN